jgi:hypothetical protein
LVAGSPLSLRPKDFYTQALGVFFWRHPSIAVRVEDAKKFATQQI